MTKQKKTNGQLLAEAAGYLNVTNYLGIPKRDPNRKHSTINELGLEDLVKAKKIIDDVLKTNPNSQEALRLYLTYLGESTHFDESFAPESARKKQIETLDKMIGLYVDEAISTPTFNIPELYSLRGELKLRDGNYAGSIEDFKQSFKFGMINVQTGDTLACAVAKYYLGEFTEAETYSTYSSNAPFMGNKKVIRPTVNFLIHYRLGKYDLAMQDLKEFLFATGQESLVDDFSKIPRRDYASIVSQNVPRLQLVLDEFYGKKAPAAAKQKLTGGGRVLFNQKYDKKIREII